MELKSLSNGLTAEAIVMEMPEKEKAPAMPPGGMGGMGGMDY